MRMTKNKQAVLAGLAELGGDFLEWGTPPYAVSILARHLGTDLSNLAKTLRLLERDGLVVKEIATVDCWNAIAHDSKPRRCVCYWLAVTMDQDRGRAAQWRASTAINPERAAQEVMVLFAR